MSSTEATEALTAARNTLDLLLQRGEESLDTLAFQLQTLCEKASASPAELSWPDEFEPYRQGRYAELRALLTSQWPELGFYDAATGQAWEAETEDVADAIDDLADLAQELEAAVRLAAQADSQGLSWLLFSRETHWGAHVDALLTHLRRAF